MSNLESNAGFVRMRGTGSPDRGLARRLLPGSQVSAVKYDPKAAIDEAAYKRLEDSIRDVGLLQPIGVDRDANLLFGRHRLEVFLRCLAVDLAMAQTEQDQRNAHVKWDTIAVMQFTDDVTPAEAEYITLAENAARKPLTNNMLARLIVLQEEMRPKERRTSKSAKSDTEGNNANGTNSSDRENNANGTNSSATTKGKRGPTGDPWMKELATASNTPYRTLMNKWVLWRDQAGRPDLEPRQATEADRLAFAAWLTTDADTKAATNTKATEAAAEGERIRAERAAADAAQMAEIAALLPMFAGKSDAFFKALVQQEWVARGGTRVVWQGKGAA